MTGRFLTNKKTKSVFPVSKSKSSKLHGSAKPKGKVTYQQAERQRMSLMADIAILQRREAKLREIIVAMQNEIR